MKTKTFGYILIVIAILMLLAFLTQLTSIKAIIIELFNSDSTASTRENGQLTGELLYYVVHVALMIILFLKGKQELKKSGG